MSVMLKALATWGDCYKANRKMPNGKPQGIVVHATGCNNPYLKRYVNLPSVCGENVYKNYFGNDGTDVNPHAVIGKDKNGAVKGVQILPYDICCWGCGSGSKGSYNYNPAYDQFEICEDGLTDKTYFEAAFDLAARFCAELMSTYSTIKIDNVVSHKEANARGYASAHGDPENWLSKFGKDMNWFRDKIKGYLKISSAVNTVPAKVYYAKLSDVVGSANASISTIFREKGASWSSGWHNGVDIATVQGTPIKAVADGVVVNADTVAHNDGFGNRVVLKHADGKATLYAHMVSTPPVKVGQSVKKGQVIGYVGNTGLSYGSHLHFTIIDNYDKNPNIYYLGDLLDPIKVCGIGTLKFNSQVSNVIVENGVSKNLGDLNKYYGVTVIVSSETITNSNVSSIKFKVGDIVNFDGDTHYLSSTAARGKECESGKAKITLIANGTAHPYHLKAESGGGSTVCGWVDSDNISVLGQKTVNEIALEVIRGDWGNGDERVKRLAAAGYDARSVQARVEVLLK